MHICFTDIFYKKKCLEYNLTFLKFEVIRFFKKKKHIKCHERHISTFSLKNKSMGIMKVMINYLYPINLYILE